MLTIYKFSAAWCSPCKIVSKIWNEVVGSNQSQGIKFIAIDIDDDPDCAIKYNIQSIPTVIFEKDGEVIDTLCGTFKKNDFVSMISKHS